ncbi:MAG: hypothetical protein F6K41_22200 [Symploca sp. SIO3E6]|nr:hypothetical protein [Caldora sp. SIO3E6]
MAALGYWCRSNTFIYGRTPSPLSIIAQNNRDRTSLQYGCFELLVQNQYFYPWNWHPASQ